MFEEIVAPAPEQHDDLGDLDDDFSDLVDAAASSADFWDNPLDDEDWNDA
jgi:hypothetical protein